MTISMTLAETAFVSRTLPAYGPAHRLAIKQTRPRNRFMMLLVAAAMAIALIAASAVPARANRNDDTLKALAAIAAIALIAKAVKDNKHGNGHPKPVQSRRVPAVCAIEIGSGRGSVVGYAERCLREEGFNYRLPTGCATNIRIYGRSDKFFPEQCLRNAGFKTRGR